MMNSFKAASIRSQPVRRLLERAAEFYDDRICTLRNARLQARRPIRSPMGTFRFSVGIPHYNRGAHIYRPLYNLLSHPAIEEIVIVDDGSDPSEFAALERVVGDLDKRGCVKIHRRPHNLGALRTKLECVERASCDWVLILDSDNTAFCHYLDRLAAQETLSPKTFYCSSWAFPYFPFYEMAGLSIDFGMAADLTASGILRRVYIINDGNYFVHRKAYVDSVLAIGDIASDVADVMVVNYHWLSHGGHLEVLPATSYYHRVHGGSFWNLTQDESRQRVLDLFSRFESSQKWNEGFASSLRRPSCQENSGRPPEKNLI